MSNISSAAVACLARCENIKTTAYQDSAGVWTIGYGHTGPEVVEGLTCTDAEALAWLEADCATADAAVARMCPAANQAQHDAMTLLAFNIGPRAFMSSTVRADHLQGSHGDAADAFLLWDKVRNADGELVVSAGLVKRRKIERDIYLGGDPLDAFKTEDAALAAERAAS